MLTAEIARAIFSYNKKNGELRWLISPRRRGMKAGNLAGSINGQGYREVMYKGKSYQVSRIIWLIVTGEWPSGEVDHRNMVRDDNRWRNLRDSTHSQNQANSKAYKNNRTGLKGVGLPDKKNGKFYPYIQVNNKKIRLGGFNTAQEAHEAWKAAAIKYRGEFARW